MRRRREMQFGAGKRAGKVRRNPVLCCSTYCAKLCAALLWTQVGALWEHCLLEKNLSLEIDLCVEKGLRGIYKEGLYSPLDPLCVMLKTLKATQVKLSQSHCYCLEQWWLSGCNCPLYLLWWKCWGVNWRNWRCRIQVPCGFHVQNCLVVPMVRLFLFAAFLLLPSFYFSQFCSFAVLPLSNTH